MDDDDMFQADGPPASSWEWKWLLVALVAICLLYIGFYWAR